ncbi:DMT family transporter [Saccharopolyspora flava]|nr:DMT family transporter [Saccharopolyspora flava]
MASAQHAPGPFAVRDWFLLLASAAGWGTSFLFIKIGAEDFAPATVAWLRLLFGAAALALVPAARVPLRVPRDRWSVVLLGLVWMAVPFVLFPAAERTIPSALAGMINGSAPLFTVLIAMLVTRKSPGTHLSFGLAVGFLGVVAVNLPEITGGGSATGVLMVLGATALYGVAFNLTGPLQARNGALPVIWRAQLAALVLSTPAGLLGLGASTPTPTALAAVAVLGIISTGVAFACFATLVGRVGAARASLATYLVPVVAVLIGAVAGEPLRPLSLVGVVLVLAGAYLSARVPRRAEVTPAGVSPR